MKTHTMIALLMFVTGLSGCASGQAYQSGSPFKKAEIQCDVSGLHTLASEVPDYWSALRGYGDETGRRSVLLD